MEAGDENQRIPCEICGEDFMSQLFRIQHIRKCHPQVLKVSCSCCDRGFENKEAVTRHKLRIQKRTQQKLNREQNMKIEKTSPEPMSKKVESLCANYAFLHGKHRAQLKYGKTYPNKEISWQKITKWLIKYNLSDKYNIKLKGVFKNKDRVSTIPGDLKKEIIQHASEHGIDAAQMHFTMRYPMYVIPYNSVNTWVHKSRYNSSNEPKNATFDKQFVSQLNTKIKDKEEFSFREIEEVILDSTSSHNAEHSEAKISHSNALDEWLHLINFRVSEAKTGKYTCTGCGSAYKLESELSKHKAKCWVPDFKDNDFGRTQRSCRNKPSQSECETIVDSDSSDSVKIEREQTTMYECSNCEVYRTQYLRVYSRHIKNCGKKSKSNDQIMKFKKDSEQGLKKQRKPEPRNIATHACTQCHFNHVSIEGLREHYRIVHDTHLTDRFDEIPLQCEKCDRTFLTYVGLREHVCGERFIKITYESATPPLGASICLGVNTPSLYLCPRCVSRFDSVELLKEHYDHKSCNRIKY